MPHSDDEPAGRPPGGEGGAAAIRPARPGDRGAIRSLIRQYPKQLLQNDLPRTASFFVAERNGRVVGCCALQVYSQRLAEVRSLAVDPEFRGRGIGKRLVEACVRRAAERGVKQLLAVSGDLGFFEKCEFATFRGEKFALFRDVAPRGASSNPCG